MSEGVDCPPPPPPPLSLITSPRASRASDRAWHRTGHPSPTRSRSCTSEPRRTSPSCPRSRPSSTASPSSNETSAQRLPPTSARSASRSLARPQSEEATAPRSSEPSLGCSSSATSRRASSASVPSVSTATSRRGWTRSGAAWATCTRGTTRSTASSCRSAIRRTTSETGPARPTSRRATRSSRRGRRRRARRRGATRTRRRGRTTRRTTTCSSPRTSTCSTSTRPTWPSDASTRCTSPPCTTSSSSSRRAQCGSSRASSRAWSPSTRRRRGGPAGLCRRPLAHPHGRVRAPARPRLRGESRLARLGRVRHGADGHCVPAERQGQGRDSPRRRVACDRVETEGGAGLEDARRRVRPRPCARRHGRRRREPVQRFARDDAPRTAAERAACLGRAHRRDPRRRRLDRSPPPRLQALVLRHPLDLRRLRVQRLGQRPVVQKVLHGRPRKVRAQGPRGVCGPAGRGRRARQVQEGGWGGGGRGGWGGDVEHDEPREDDELCFRCERSGVNRRTTSADGHCSPHPLSGSSTSLPPRRAVPPPGSNPSPPATQPATLLYAYTASSPYELTLDDSAVGSTLEVVEPEDDNGWVKVRVPQDGRVGLVPASYVEIGGAGGGAASGRGVAAGGGGGAGTVVALYDYAPQTSDEVELQEGEQLSLTATGFDAAEGWAEVTKDGRTGLVPAAYVSLAPRHLLASRLSARRDGTRRSSRSASEPC
ncbi:hypothetical protein DMC30DRAFT_270871 [Rhodotorula diobovata]|uniref:SH3 domain-containing protein n=1 Tax=Rhodotorula diobovata TaxID=5288 RepID=A0A5C5FTU9_9BASI|nr:hypothetical protein DMC30DRAFT_270871 [Rhodotorula diobovata]